MIDRIKNIRFGFREDYDPDKRIVKQDIIKIYNDEYFISTVDLGTNHSFIENYDEYFETMILKIMIIMEYMKEDMLQENKHLKIIIYW